jgi:predicted transcriptional regulator
MVSRAELERLRLEADTIMTRIERVQTALERARQEAGDHWEDGELDLALETPAGETVDVTLDLDDSAAENAQRRYEQAKALEPALERKARVDDRLDPMPADPVAYLVCYHLDAVEGNYPKSMAGHLSADRKHVEGLCKELVETGVLERVESGTVKQRNVKAKQADEVRQHHTYYRLSREGDHLLRFLDEREGKLNVLRHLPDATRALERARERGAGAVRPTADELDVSFERARHCYRALQRLGPVTESDGPPEQTAGDDAAADTYYAPTSLAGSLLDELDG